MVEMSQKYTRNRPSTKMGDHSVTRHKTRVVQTVSIIPPHETGWLIVELKRTTKFNIEMFETIMITGNATLTRPTFLLDVGEGRLICRDGGAKTYN